MTHYDHFDNIPAAVWIWPSFGPKEMSCRKSGALLLIPDFMDRLQALRSAYGKPLTINSGYRSPAYDKAIGGAGVHTTGRAVDIGICGAAADRLIELSYRFGFTGRGVRQNGAHAGRFIHLDDLAAAETRGPRPWMWSY